MSDKSIDPTIAQRVELAVSQLDCLSSDPCVITQFLSQLNQFQLSPPDLAKIIESDPALTSKLLALAYKHGVKISTEELSIGRLLEELPLREVRDAILSVKVSLGLGENEQKLALRKEFIKHSLAAACCAEDIALAIDENPSLCYLAGLLHNIGNFALADAMPRSFVTVIEQAKAAKASICQIQQENLGTDYTILGKRLAQKWHFPQQLILAIWLHQSNPGKICLTMPQAKIASIVQLACITARQCNIGRSGSFEPIEETFLTAQSLGINSEQLQKIQQMLPNKVAQRCKIIGLEMPDALKKYCAAIHTAASQLAQDNTKFSADKLSFQTATARLNFVAELISTINSSDSPLEIAELIANRWQKFYQTGPVCLYLLAPDASQYIPAVLVESQSQARTVLLNIPAQAKVLPELLKEKFGVASVDESLNWFFDQLDMDFDLGSTVLVPLLAGTRAIGAIVFEMRHPVKQAKLEEELKVTTLIAAVILDFNIAARQNEIFAEHLAQSLTRQKQRPMAPAEQKPKAEIESDGALSAIAEMAAGAAHELNNPLSVISGRVQLLAGSESDADKQKMLTQIQQNTDQISRIIDDLMAFAQPPQPRPAQTDIKQILDEAIQLTTAKTGAEHINTQIEIAEGLKSMLADSAQIASAVANIICNSIESYTDQLGPIKITAEPAENGQKIKLQISDLGRGMDSQTLKKAAQPFFSAKPAGRKRGMGLAHAQRLIQINKGSLEITSEPDKGTTATILLPCS
ncbi:MAG: HDOD domain-containing protein [Sedimentisphaerales bacterium]|nr:HDOD domain-containing protein [Sedimentisphaerales bacterium]